MVVVVIVVIVVRKIVTVSEWRRRNRRVPQVPGSFGFQRVVVVVVVEMFVVQPVGYIHHTGLRVIVMKHLHRVRSRGSRSSIVL